MTLLDMIILTVAAVLAGALNAVAGGGSFLTFPALMLTGINPISANATNAVVVWPGAIASTWGYRRELGTQRQMVILLSIVSVVGGLLGGLLLLWFRDYEETFARMVPYLLLVATLLFAFGNRLTAWMKARLNFTENSRTAMIIGAVLHMLISIYGGFFGGGMGVLMLAAFTLLGLGNIHVMNGIKSLVSVLIKGAAVVAFIVSGVVVWPQAIVMIIGAVVGGYAGAHYSRQIEPRLVKNFAIVVGFVMTIIFFVRP